MLYQGFCVKRGPDCKAEAPQRFSRKIGTRRKQEAYYEGEDKLLDDDEVPEELDEAYDVAEEAFVIWQDARKKMNELARTRGFYPVEASTPQSQVPVAAQRQTHTKPKGGKSKGKGGKPKSGKSLETYLVGSLPA